MGYLAHAVKYTLPDAVRRKRASRAFGVVQPTRSQPTFIFFPDEQVKLPLAHDCQIYTFLVAKRNFMKDPDDIPENVVEPGFVHSLFRSGSTYFYNALKRGDGFTPYHEPFHEVIGELTSSWDEMVNRTEQIKSLLRHDFLQGTYFDEYSHLLPYIKKSFTQDVSYATFFLEGESECACVKSYVDCLVIGARSRPILQCTRSFGRIEWLRKNYGGTHLYLLRNPWDQWFS